MHIRQCTMVRLRSHLCGEMRTVGDIEASTNFMDVMNNGMLTLCIGMNLRLVMLGLVPPPAVAFNLRDKYRRGSI